MHTSVVRQHLLAIVVEPAPGLGLSALPGLWKPDLPQGDAAKGTAAPRPAVKGPVGSEPAEASPFLGCVVASAFTKYQKSAS